jgi:anti-sigma regulatory factor (Ser/Thr protein kinase)
MSAAAPVTAWTVEDTGWFPVTDAGSVGVVRRAAENLGRALNLSAERVGELALVSAELTTNLHKYAVDAVVHLRRVRYGEARGVEVLAIDSGPGMADLELSTRDGHSTSGSLGIGLGAVQRQATRVDGYTRPGRGTVLAASVWSEPPPPSAAEGLVRPIAGETVSGDAYAVRDSAGRLQAMLCDGLGHGPLAALAAEHASTAFGTAPDGGPRLVLEHLHRRLARTRGAVAAVVEVIGDTVHFAGLGNISAWVTDGGRRKAMTSMPGIVGNQRPEIKEFEYRLPPGAVIVMHTDGLTHRWDLTPYPGLLNRQPLLVAATLLRDAGRRHDDAGILVARAP